jgi:hypothetical protein
MPHRECLSEQELSAYQLGELPADEAAEVEQHLADCRRCAESLALLDELADEESWREARARLTEAEKFVGFSPRISERQAVLQLQFEKPEQYRSICAEVLKQLPARPSDKLPLETILWSSWLCTLGPDGSADWDRLLAWTSRLEQRLLEMEKGEALDEIESLVLYLGLYARVAVLFRAGKNDEALKLIDRLAQSSSKRPEGLHSPLMALVRARAGQPTEARACLVQSRRWLDGPRAKDTGLLGMPPWIGKLSVRLLHREAEKLLADQSARE